MYLSLCSLSEYEWWFGILLGSKGPPSKDLININMAKKAMRVYQVREGCHLQQTVMWCNGQSTLVNVSLVYISHQESSKIWIAYGSKFFPFWLDPIIKGKQKHFNIPPTPNHATVSVHLTQGFVFSCFRLMYFLDVIISVEEKRFISIMLQMLMILSLLYLLVGKCCQKITRWQLNSGCRTKRIFYFLSFSSFQDNGKHSECLKIKKVPFRRVAV